MPQAGAQKAARRRKADWHPTEAASLHRMLEATGDLFYQWDLGNDRVHWAGQAAPILGIGPEAAPLTGADLIARIVLGDRHGRQAALLSHLEGKGAYDCEYRLRGCDGVLRWVHDRGALVRDEAAAVPSLLGSLRLLNGARLCEPEIAFRANHDPLTGHFTQGRFHELVERAIADGRRHGSPSAVAILEVSDAEGQRQAFDSSPINHLLAAVGGRLDEELRDTDVVGRLNGHRFAVLLGHCDAAGARRALARLGRSITARFGSGGGTGSGLRFRFGVVVVPAQAQTSLDALAKAETALRRMPSRPDARPTFYRVGPIQDRAQQAALRVAGDVEAALKADALCLAFQPVADPQSKAARYHECLLRRRLPDGRVAAAADFVVQVERTGLIRRIDRKVLEMTLDELCRHPGIVLACNISGLTAADHSWLRALWRRLSRRPDLARRLIVEITETASLPDQGQAARFVSALHRMGCRVALDDFGTGCTRFRHLRMLDLDIVKIDGTFVDGIRCQPQKQAFLRNLLALARDLRMTTVAERVETEADADYLTDHGVDLLQGYQFGGPTLTPTWRR